MAVGGQRDYAKRLESNLTVHFVLTTWQYVKTAPPSDSSVLCRRNNKCGWESMVGVQLFVRRAGKLVEGKG